MYMGIYSNILKYSKLNTVDKLFKWMNKNMKYAYVTVDGEVSEDFDHMYPDYRLQSPEECFQSKVGVCWDQAIFEQFIFENIIHKKCKLYYIVQDNQNQSTHTFIFFEDKGKIYYFENSFENIRGIYEVEDIDKTFEFIIENMRKDKDDNGVEVYEVNKDINKYTKGFTEKTDIISFMEFCQSCKLIYYKR